MQIATFRGELESTTGSTAAFQERRNCWRHKELRKRGVGLRSRRLEVRILSGILAGLHRVFVADQCKSMQIGANRYRISRSCRQFGRLSRPSRRLPSGRFRCKSVQIVTLSGELSDTMALTTCEKESTTGSTGEGLGRRGCWTSLPTITRKGRTV